MKLINLVYLLVIATSVLGSQEELEKKEIIFSKNAPDRFVDVLDYFVEDPLYNQEKTASKYVSLEVEISADQMHVKAAKKGEKRNYDRVVTSPEKNDLSYILNALARNTWASILSEKSSIKKAGARINHLHPLRFLMTIFTDEQLKADISAVRSRGIIWRNFFEGLEESLKQESQRDNMRSEYIVDFANTVGIGEKLISPSIKDKQWKEFVNILIDKIPRAGNPTRYDM